MRRWLRRVFLRLTLWGLVLALVASFGAVGLLRYLPPPTTAFMLQSRRADPATGRACDRIAYLWVPWSEISPHLPRAVVVSEDQRFLEHAGFDTKAIGDAVSEVVAGGRLRGASTISQQVAKNLFLWPGRSFVRKVLEAGLTVLIELLWPKRRILEVYLNVAQFGPCTFGVEAASIRYLGTRATRVTPHQAARLATVLPSPGSMRVDEPGPFALERAREIVVEMHREGGPGYLRGL